MLFITPTQVCLSFVNDENSTLKYLYLRKFAGYKSDLCGLDQLMCNLDQLKYKYLLTAQSNT